jgi:hypothetical protein
MSDIKKPRTFMTSCKEYFGFKPGQSLVEFRDEVNALSPQDRKEIAEGLSKHFGEPVAA